MSDEPSKSSEIQDELKGFLDTNVAYYKLYLFKVIANASSSIIGIVIVAIFALSTIFFLSIAASIFIGYLLGNLGYGFLIIGLVYLLLTMLISFQKDKILEHYIIKKFSKFF